MTPVRGQVLYLGDPCSWHTHDDVRPFMGKREYAVRFLVEECPMKEKPCGGCISYGVQHGHCIDAARQQAALARREGEPH
jgi:hypothetical protein